MLSKLNTLIAEVTGESGKYELGVAVAKVYDFVWDTYCDWYIELTKARLYSDDADQKDTALKVLVYVLDQVLRLLHPFMPFITEEIWQSLPHEVALIVAKWPEYSEALAFPRRRPTWKRDERHPGNPEPAGRDECAPSKKAELSILAVHPEVFAEGEGFLQRLAYADKVTILDKEPENLEGLVCCTADAKLYIPMGQLVDVAKELERTAKELEKARKNLASIQGKLSNENFTARARRPWSTPSGKKAAKAAALIAQLEQSEAMLKKL